MLFINFLWFFNVILKDLVEIFLVQFFFFSLYPLGSGSGSIWTFFGSWIRICIIIDADPQHWSGSISFVTDPDFGSSKLLIRIRIQGNDTDSTDPQHCSEKQTCRDWAEWLLAGYEWRPGCQSSVGDGPAEPLCRLRPPPALNSWSGAAGRWLWTWHWPAAEWPPPWQRAGRGLSCRGQLLSPALKEANNSI